MSLDCCLPITVPKCVNVLGNIEIVKIFNHAWKHLLREMLKLWKFINIVFKYALYSHLQVRIPKRVQIFFSKKYVTIHHKTSVKSPLGHFHFMLYLGSTCPKL